MADPTTGPGCWTSGRKRSFFGNGLESTAYVIRRRVTDKEDEESGGYGLQTWW